MDTAQKSLLSEQRFRAVLDAVHDCFINLTPDGVMLYANRAASELLGWRRDELAGRHVSTILPEGAGDVLLAAMAEPESSRAVHRVVFRTKSGLLTPVEMTVSPAPDPDGDLSYLCCARDRREDADAERQLQSSREFFEALVQSTVDLIFVKDRQGRYVMVNRAFLDLAGLREDAVIGRTDAELLPEAQARPLMAADQEVLSTGEIRRGEENLSLSDKSLRFAHCKTPIHDADGRVVGLVGVARDVTAERAMTQQLAQTQKMAAVGALAGRVAHEFGDLLTALLRDLTLAETRLQCGEDAAPAVRGACGLAQNAVELTNRLLYFAENRPVEFARVAAAEVVEEALGAVRSQFEPRLEIRTRVNPAAWPVMADRGQLRQVVTSLCWRARDSLEARYGALGEARAGEAWIEIVVENIAVKPGVPAFEPQRAKPGDYVRLTISDNGAGIPADALPHIFEPFFESRDARRESGLALSLVYAAVTSHGGWIAVESEPDLGTDFIVYLPRAADEEQQSAAAPSLLAADEPRPPKILVIDDDPGSRLLQERLLGDCGSEVVAAGCGARAWDLLRAENSHFDLIVLDLVMPEMSGGHFVELMRQNDINVPVLICTAFPDEIAMQQVSACGVDDFISKPFSSTEFVDKVRATLAKGAGQKRAD